MTSQSLRTKAAFLRSLPLADMDASHAVALARQAGFDAKPQDIYVARNKARRAEAEQSPRVLVAPQPRPVEPQPRPVEPPSKPAAAGDLERELRRLMLRVGIERAQAVLDSLVELPELH